MKRNIDIIVINLTFLIVGMILYFLVDDRIEIMGAVVATGISLSLGIRQSKAENDRIFKELFTEFNTKYDVKFNNELQRIVNSSRMNEEYKLNPDEVNTIIDYLNFCSEEYLWKTKNRIPDEVWNSWENGIIYYLKIPLINEIFFNERNQKSSYYGLFERMEKKLKNT